MFACLPIRFYQAEESIVRNPGKRWSTVSGNLPAEYHTYNYESRSGANGPYTTFSIRRLAAIQLACVRDSHSISMEIGEKGTGAYYVSTVLNGTMTLLRPEGGLMADRESGLIYRAEPGTRIVASDNCSRFNVWFSAASVHHAIENMLNKAVPVPIAFSPAIAWSSSAGKTISGMMRLLVDDLRRESELLTGPVNGRLYAETMLNAILIGLPHNYSAELSAGKQKPAPRIVQKALEYFHAHALDDITVADAACAAGCSVRSLQAGFRSYSNMTPLEALRHIRLDLARVALARNDGTSIAEIAASHGFAHLGRFAALFRHAFGCLPSKM